MKNEGTANQTNMWNKKVSNFSMRGDGGAGEAELWRLLQAFTASYDGFVMEPLTLECSAHITKVLWVREGGHLSPASPGNKATHISFLCHATGLPFPISDTLFCTSWLQGDYVCFYMWEAQSKSHTHSNDQYIALPTLKVHCLDWRVLRQSWSLVCTPTWSKLQDPPACVLGLQKELKGLALKLYFGKDTNNAPQPCSTGALRWWTVGGCGTFWIEWSNGLTGYPADSRVVISRMYLIILVLINLHLTQLASPMKIIF